MKKIKEKIERAMNGKKIESRGLDFGLFLLSKIYGGIIVTRNLLFKWNMMPCKKLPCKVISIGNLCVGGTGKTPMALYTARMLKEMGINVCVVSRGYKGRAEKNGGIVSDGGNLLMDAAAAGDEPFMMAQMLTGIPVIVGRDRFLAGMTAVNRFGAEVIVLDDGFQHRKLFRDVDLVLLDWKAPFGNSRLLPRGRLREPVGSLARSHGLVFTRSERQTPEQRQTYLSRKSIGLDKRHFFAYHEAYLDPIVPYEVEHGGNNPEYKAPKDFCALHHKNVFAFSGVADNHEFLKTVNDCCGPAKGFLAFPDHHAYKAQDFEAIIRGATEIKADIIVTTCKDSVKIPHDLEWPMAFAVIGIKMSLGEDESAFKAFLMEKLNPSQ